MSVEFFTVPTVPIQILLVFLVLDHSRCRTLHFGEDFTRQVKDLGGRGTQPTNNSRHVALRAVPMLILLQPRRPASQSGKLLAEALSLVGQSAEGLTILSLLPSFPPPECLDVARAAQRYAQVADEAKIAFDEVAETPKLT